MGSSSGARVVRGGEIVLQREDLAGLMRAVLEKGKAFRFEVRGASMRPVIRDGDVVTVSPLAGGAAKTGDVVAFVNPATGGSGSTASSAGRDRITGSRATTPTARTAWSRRPPSWAGSRESSARGGPSP